MALSVQNINKEEKTTVFDEKPSDTNKNSEVDECKLPSLNIKEENVFHQKKISIKGSKEIRAKRKEDIINSIIKDPH